MHHEIQPVAVVNGVEYFWGTKENPFNFFPNIGIDVTDKEQMRSHEREQIFKQGSTLRLVEVQDESYPSYRPYIRAGNIALRQSIEVQIQAAA